jgi:hypothetical protein
MGKERLGHFAKDQNGQVTLFVILFMVGLIAFMLSIPNVTYVTGWKMRGQTASDIGAYTVSIWLARALNLIAVLNIGIRWMWVWMLVLTIVLAVALVLYAAGHFPLLAFLIPIACAISAVFFGQGDPIGASSVYPDALKALRNSAIWLNDLQDDIAQSFPLIALGMGTTEAYKNMHSSLPSLERGGFAFMQPKIDKIPLQEDFGGISDFMQGLSGGFNNYGHDCNGSSTVNPDGSVTSTYKIKYVDEMWILQKLRHGRGKWRIIQCADSQSLRKKYAATNWQKYPEDGDVFGSPYHPIGSAWLPALLPLQIRGWTLLPPPYSRVDTLERAVPDDGSVDEYWQPETRCKWCWGMQHGMPGSGGPGYDWEQFTPQQKEAELTKYYYDTPARTFVPSADPLYTNAGYSIKYARLHEHKVEIECTKTTGPSENPGGNKGFPKRVADGFDPYSLCFTWWIQSSPLGLRPVMAKSLFKPGTAGSPLPMICLAEAQPYLDVDNPSKDDSFFSPSWDARLWPIAEEMADSVNSQIGGQLGGSSFDFKKLLGYVLLH